MRRRADGGEARSERGVSRAPWWRALGMSLALTTVALGLVALPPEIPPAEAAPSAATAPAAATLSGSDFDPGFIISDQLFYDGGAMTATEIQNFLNAKIGACQTGRCLNVATVASPGYPQRNSPDTGRLVCTAVSGGSMSVAEWIYRVQVACGISAKVILVTLQKEQSLIEGAGARAPSDWALMQAMGMACPDTAPCDTAFSGLATQIYTGTRQLKTYRAGAFGRQPGTHFVQYSPNAACGGSWVDVRNHATAALYNYTPYQPNAAALAAMPGRGNDCSSYGNRNFWYFYNNWFGSPVSGEGPGANAISEAWAANGGLTGPWGNRLAWMPCNTGVTCGHTFENAYVGWTTSGGIFVATGRMRDWVVSQGTSVIGSPTSAEVPVTQNGGGIAQAFTNGLVNWGPAGPFLVSGDIRDEHGRLGGVGATAGWPTSAMVCDSERYCTQSFQNAVLGSVPLGGGVSVVDPTILAYYRAGGGVTGPLGPPQSRAVAVAANGGGSQQAFRNGLVNVTPGGTFTITNLFRTAQSVAGGVGGPIGWPTSEQSCGVSTCSQAFQHALFLARGSQVRALDDPALLSYFQASGGVAGSLGFPLTDKIVVASSPNGGGWQMGFEYGLVESSAAGTFTVKDAIRDAHGRAGGVAGSLGWPTAEQSCTSGVCSQSFQKGIIYVAPGGAARVIDSMPIAAYFQAAGGASGALGYPLTGTVPVAESSPNGGGVQVAFQFGLVESSAAGTFTVKDAIRDAHGRAGGVAGQLGWPTGEQSCVSGACSQSFQGGTILVSASGSVTIARTVADPTIAAYYEAAGGASGALGYPLTGTVPVAESSPNGGGVQVAFQFGLVESSAAGTFTVKDAIRDAHGRAGGVAGQLGWPTGEQSCVSGACSQSFQGGTILVSASGSVTIARTVADPTIAAYYEAAGGASGALGYPLTGTVPVAESSPNGGGVQVAFQFGLVESSAAGTFTVKDAIRDAHGRAGGVAGQLGWPTGEQSCVSGACSQSFQGGTILVSASGSVTIARTVADPTIAAYYEAAGGASGALGYPLTGTVPVAESSPNGGGVQVAFQFGLVESSAAGTFTVKDAIRDAHGRSGGVAGPYGWPTGEQTCGATTCSQTFQNGTITVSR